MAARNSRKRYSPNTYYHIYNRGVEKRPIFKDEQDYAVFLSYLKEYLLPKNTETLRLRLADPKLDCRQREKVLKELRLNNFNGEIFLIAYCLMPNHFHFLLKQKTENSIDKFINSLGIRYSMYFNRKYKRVGSLYQGVYKAVNIETDQQLLYLTGYIHRNPIDAPKLSKLASQDQVLRTYLSQPSTYPEYLGLRRTGWIYPQEILSFFSRQIPNLTYQAFVQQTNDTDLVQDIALDL